jgi:hypothetical protein
MENNKLQVYKSKKMFWVVITAAIFILATSIWLGMKITKNKSVAENSFMAFPEMKSKQTITQSDPNNPETEDILIDAISVEDNTAQIKVGEEEIQLTFNARGELPRITVLPKADISATVKFPNTVSGQKISVQAEDGGLLIDDAASGIVLIDDQQQAHFKFKLSAYDGQYRVTLRNGGESRVLEFWVGPEPPVIVRK